MNKLFDLAYDTYFMARLTGCTHSQATLETYAIWFDLDRVELSAYIAKRNGE